MKVDVFIKKTLMTSWNLWEIFIRIIRELLIRRLQSNTDERYLWYLLQYVDYNGDRRSTTIRSDDVIEEHDETSNK